MALPAAALIDGTALAAWLGLEAPAPGDDPEELEELAAAVDELIRELPGTLLFCDGLTDWPNRWTRGAKMWAGRLHRRRMSPEGVYQLTDNAVAYVNRNDPDVATLLRLNVPAVG